jgi:hypothetical protein
MLRSRLVVVISVQCVRPQRSIQDAVGLPIAVRLVVIIVGFPSCMRLVNHRQCGPAQLRDS